MTWKAVDDKATVALAILAGRVYTEQEFTAAFGWDAKTWPSDAYLWSNKKRGRLVYWDGNMPRNKRANINPYLRGK